MVAKSFGNLPTSAVGRWTPIEVAAAVANIGKVFEPYAQLIHDEGVDGPTFIAMFGAEDAWAEIGVTRPMHKTRLVELHTKLVDSLLNVVANSLLCRLGHCLSRQHLRRSSLKN